MKTKKISLREFQIPDISIVDSVYNSNFRLSINKNYNKTKLEIIKNNLKKNKKFIKTIIFDNQRIGLILKKKVKVNILLRYRYMKIINYRSIYNLIKKSK